MCQILSKLLQLKGYSVLKAHEIEAFADNAIYFDFDKLTAKKSNQKILTRFQQNAHDKNDHQSQKHPSLNVQSEQVKRPKKS